MKNFIRTINKFLIASAVLLLSACLFSAIFAGASGELNAKKFFTAFADESGKLEKTVLNAETMNNGDFTFYGSVKAEGGRVAFTGGTSAETKKETKFFNAFLSGVKGETLRFAFGKNYVKVDAAAKKITLYSGGVKTETELNSKTDLSEYFLYIEVENGRYTETVVNDKYVLTYIAGGVKVGIAGAGEAEYKAFDFAAEGEIKEFSYGKIAIDATGGELSFKECKIFPIDTGYEIPTRDYDEKDDEIIREEKPERLTEKQKKQKTLFIALVAGGGAVLVALFAGITVTIVKKRGKKGGKRV